MGYEKDRETLKKAHRGRDPDTYVAKRQRQSIDGLPVTPPDRYIAGDDEDANEAAE